MYVCILSFVGINGKQYTEEKTRISKEEYNGLSDVEKNCFIDEDIKADNPTKKNYSIW